VTTTLANERTGAPNTRRRGSLFWVMTAVVLLALGAGGTAYLGGPAKARARVEGAYKNFSSTPKPHPVDEPAAQSPLVTEVWDGLVRVTPDEEKAIGFHVTKVKAQDGPMKLELTGRTAYDDTTITKIRPRFDARVEKVLAAIGKKIKKGDPLVELYSTDLASAKSDFQSKYVQWRHDRSLYNLREKLVATGAISQQLWVDTQNEEQKSRLEYKLVQDKLAVFYDVPKDEIDPLLENLGEKVPDSRNFGIITNKAKMTLRAKADGYVISRTVVPGNFYESTDTLMEIAPLDHLHVWVNVYELDQDKVRVGQGMEIQFPYLALTIQGRVDYVAPEVSKETRAVKIRAVIPNADARIKSDMLVKALLEIPPLPGQTVVPRLSMVSLSGGEYVFLKVPRPAGDKSRGVDVECFQRVKIQVAQENTDSVVVASGLKAGQEVVTNGSLILSQLHEDQEMTVTGMSSQ